MIWDDFVVLGVRCDIVVCAAAEPAPSSGIPMSAAGAAALAGALKKNTSLQTLDLIRESLFLDFLLSDFLFLKGLFLSVLLFGMILWYWGCVVIVLFVLLLNLRHH